MTSDAFRDQAIHTALAYLRAQDTRDYTHENRQRNQTTIVRMRDSLIYRSDALAWHAGLVDWLQQTALQRLYKTIPDPNAPYDVMRTAQREQQFAFDDVVFNAIALFDYVGNTIGFAFYGDRRRKAKWDRVQDYARKEHFDKHDHTKPRIFGSEVGRLVASAEVELVSRLSDYRASLIHYETVPAGGGVTTKLTKNPAATVDFTFDITITVPGPFAKRFAVPGFENERSKAPLPLAARWIVSEVLGRCLSILRALEKDLLGEGAGDP